MTRMPLRYRATAALALALPAAMPLGAQENPGTFTLPSGTPAPTATPAGPADERGTVTIPPQGIPAATPSATPAQSPSATVQPGPTASPSPRTTAPAPTRPLASQVPASTSPVAATPEAVPVPDLTGAPSPSASGAAAPSINLAVPPVGAAEDAPSRPDWWPYAAGGLGGLVVLAGGLAAWRRRKPRVLRLAAPAAGADDGDTPAEAQLDLTLEITSATRSLMRFALGYRLTIANRSPRAVLDVSVTTQLACARASAGQGPSAGAAQGLGRIARIGPHQAQSITGEVHLPLAAIQPLRQGTTPLFIPLVHVTLEGEGVRPLTRTFVIGPRSASGRVHPISLEGGPGGIAGLVAQLVALPGDSAAAA